MPVSKNRRKKKKNRSLVKKKRVKTSPESRMMKKMKGYGLENYEIGKFKDSVSELVLDFSHDLIERCISKEDYEKYIPFIIICWNIGNIEEEYKREEEIKRLLQQLQIKEIEEELRMLIKRKLEYYSEYKYAILNYDISYPEGKFYLVLASVRL